MRNDYPFRAVLVALGLVVPGMQQRGRTLLVLVCLALMAWLALELSRPLPVALVVVRRAAALRAPEATPE